MAAEDEITITVRLRGTRGNRWPNPRVEHGNGEFIGWSSTGSPVFGVGGVQYSLADSQEFLNQIRAASQSPLTGDVGSIIDVHLLHMCENDDQLLQEDVYPIVSIDVDNGWLVNCNKRWLTNERLEAAKQAGYSREFLYILRSARDAGFNYAWFDLDTEPEPDLPVFAFEVENENPADA